MGAQSSQKIVKHNRMGARRAIKRANETDNK